MSGQNFFVKTLNLVVLDKKERQPGHPFIKDISLICTFGHLKTPWELHTNTKFLPFSLRMITKMFD